jgi:CheY-like chemotaxis protein
MSPLRWRRKAVDHVHVLAAEEPEPKPRVHVCDDNASVTQVLDMMLSLDGWRVEITTNGTDCLTALREAPPDVLVLDQRMPGLTGLGVAEQARAGGFDRPILLFSAHLEREEWDQLNEFGLLPVNKLDFPAVVRHVRAARRQYVARTRRRAEPEAPAE